MVPYNVKFIKLHKIVTLQRNSAKDKKNLIKVGSCNNSYISQWCVQGSYTLLLGNQASYRAIHLQTKQTIQTSYKGKT